MQPDLALKILILGFFFVVMPIKLYCVMTQLKKDLDVSAYKIQEFIPTD